MAYFTTAEGAGEHCHVGSLLRTHQVIFDWLDETLAPTAAAFSSDHRDGDIEERAVRG
jgi:hypothetical protein